MQSRTWPFAANFERRIQAAIDSIGLKSSGRNIMARIVGAVDFEDGRRLFFVYCNTTDVALRPLFESAEAAEQWIDERPIEFVAPANAVRTEERVQLVLNLDSPGAKNDGFPSRASAKAMWLTGPRSMDELVEENGRINGGGDGYGRPEKPVN